MKEAVMESNLPVIQNPKWVRSQYGIIAGVCEGIGRTFDIDPWIVRLVWIVSVLFLGTGLLFYLICALALPRQDRWVEAQDKKILGVCARISRSADMEVGLVRL